MTKPRWARVEELYHAALERPAADRQAFLVEACGRDEALRSEIQSLLDHEQEADRMMEEPAAGVMTQPVAVVRGTRLGPYEVMDFIGAGGMGEVYRARDTRLGREVAVKVLPAEFASEPTLRARFEREARAVSALNHPNICTLHDVGDASGLPYLVMELVEGPTLAECLKEGPQPISEALKLAHQIAEGLQAAHERGILHRDLKPHNIKVTPEGRVKLLDFGLAKMLKAERLGEAFSEKATATADATGAGVAMGTVPYMSPEQARGEALDRRTDVWAFGCVLYEMLAGGRAFPGPSGAEALVAVLEREPDWAALPAAMPVSLRKLLRRSLEKDKARRIHDIGDARLELEEAQVDLGSRAGPASPAATRRRPGKLFWLGGLVVAAAGLGAWLAFRSLPSEATPPTRRLTLAPPPRTRLMDPFITAQHLVISRRGDRVAFSGESDTVRRLYVRAINDIEALPIPGTESANNPFFSPDGRWLGFEQEGRLRKVLLDGGSPVTIAAIPNVSRCGASWGQDDTIVVGGDTGLWRVPADGGTLSPVTTPDASRGEVSHRWPQILPGGRDVLFTIVAPRHLPQDARIGVVSLETREWRVVAEGTGYARFSPTGHLISARLGSLFAAAFDPARLTLTGPAVPVLDDVQMNVAGGLYADFDVSASGALVYVPGFSRPLERSLLWVNRQGHREPVTRTRRPFVTQPRLSPDGHRLAVTVETQGGGGDMWVLDLDRDAWTRLTSQRLGNTPEWSPDGRWLAFTTADAAGSITRIAADGSSAAEGPSGPLGTVNLDAWLPDGRGLVFSQLNNETWYDIGIWKAEGGTPRLLLASPYLECCAALSPDGHWMAFVSNESGRFEIYAQPFPGPGAKRPVSTEGGIQPRWSRDGRELFYRTLGERPKLIATPMETRGDLRVGPGRPLFDDVFAGRMNYFPATYDVSLDGQRFLFIEEPEAAPIPRQIVLIPNWSDELRAKLKIARP